MKSITLMLFALCLSFSHQLIGQDTDAALATVRQAVYDFHAYDAVAYGDNFLPSAVQVNPMGQSTSSRAQIVQEHDWLFKNPWKDLTGKATIVEEATTALGTDVVLVRMLVNGDHTTPTGENAYRSTVQLVAAVVPAGDGSWKIAHLHLTPVLSQEQAADQG